MFRIFSKDIVCYGNETKYKPFSYILKSSDGTTALGSCGCGISSGSYSAFNGVAVTVDWGDGNTTVISDGNFSNITHTYTVAQATVIITSSKNNTLPAVNFNGNSQLYKILTPIPKLSALTSMDYTFKNCTSLTSIPADLFKYNTEITNMASTFNNCTSLTSIPADLFKYNTEITNMDYTFNGCASLTSIPADLFKYNTKIEYMDGTFNNCTSLTSIPADLFKYNIATTNMSNTFNNCTSLTSIPADLFKYNIATTNMSSTFNGCTSLTSIPADLFKYNIATTNMSSTFNGCTSLLLTSDIFGTDYTSRFANVSSLDFSEMFSRSSYSGSSVGVAPDLWNFTLPDNLTLTACFGGDGNSTSTLSNYSSIPDKWKYY